MLNILRISFKLFLLTCGITELVSRSLCKLLTQTKQRLRTSKLEALLRCMLLNLRFDERLAARCISLQKRNPFTGIMCNRHTLKIVSGAKWTIQIRSETNVQYLNHLLCTLLHSFQVTFAELDVNNLYHKNVLFMYCSAEMFWFGRIVKLYSTKKISS